MKPKIFPSDSTIDLSKKRVVKFGIDPTSDMLHLGHLIPLLQAKKLLEEGHDINIVLGTFTAQMGDPSGKDVMRPILNAETTKKNAESILSQVKRVLGDNFKVHFNHKWFENMSAVEMLGILSKFTTTQLLSRDSFQKRTSEGNPIGMHELVVPVLQGMDSVFLGADIEIGGTDQLFNFAITRDVQRVHDQEPEICMLMPIINGTDGRKMSKSFGNCIFLNDKPEDVFGKVMSISDELMKEWWPIFIDDQINMKDPMQQKKRLALVVTDKIWGYKNAMQSLEHFENTIQNKKLPESINEIQGVKNEDGTVQVDVIEIIKKIRNCSKNEARRLIKSNAVRLIDKEGEEQIVFVEAVHIAIPGIIVKIGKRDFVKII
jgi:tyrosyl-tRNA synthetase